MHRQQYKGLEIFHHMSTYFPIAGNLDGVKTEEDMASRHVLYTKVDEEQSLQA
jgi:hypothetical protein